MVRERGTKNDFSVDDEQWERKRFVEKLSTVLPFCLADETLKSRWQLGSWRVSLEFRGEDWSEAAHLVITLS